MKKLLIIGVSLITMLALAACGNNGQSGSGSETPASATTSGDTVVLEKSDIPSDFSDEDITYTERITLTFDGEIVSKASVVETYANEDAAKETEEYYTGDDYYSNLKRSGKTITYDYSEERCEDEFSDYADKNELIDEYVNDMGFTKK